ncbi:MAG: MoxR family ATPase [Lachnospiraceae bacterium]|nr:MoxR family ATPase [Lachnospiraceae bacterium]
MSAQNQIEALISNIGQVIVGKRDVIELTVTAMLTGGHVLLEDIPGVGKTQLAASLAASCGGAFNRLQLTPDVMPSDVTGFTLIDQSTRQMVFRQGAAFCNFLLADEINRASPKTQSALLEVMEESQISIDGKTYEIPTPFMVLATQNPIDTFGTYHLPEAQMDRFLMRLKMGYPGRDNELTILNKTGRLQAKDLSPVTGPDGIEELKLLVQTIHCSERISSYILDITEATRQSEEILLGVSPRGSLALHHASRSFALVQGRDYVAPDDVKRLAPHVLSHRILLTPQGRSRYGGAEKAILALLDRIEVPTC